MSEVAPMYLQGRLPGWFNRLFASSRLVAPVQKLDEVGAPDVRLEAVGEAERRAGERAVVDTMKEALIGPRAVIVHTDLRNAYNKEAWRRTIIQSHIDCSPLHHVIPAHMAPLSTDSYWLVGDRSAPLRSEDGVQHGAPLATTSFRIAIHPEVQQWDNIMLEVADRAARFNADDGFLMGLPEHVWPALNAFRTSMKASVGLEVRFVKMRAYYIADMEAAQYVQAYMRGKAEALREKVDANSYYLPSPTVGSQIILPSTEHNPVIVDLYVDALMNLPAP
eukprot:jgi/Tetstr1/447380/TSEL_034817.t1